MRDPQSVCRSAVEINVAVDERMEMQCGAETELRQLQAITVAVDERMEMQCGPSPNTGSFRQSRESG